MVGKWTTSYVPLNNLLTSPRSARDAHQSLHAPHLDELASDQRYTSDARTAGIDLGPGPPRARHALGTPLQEETFNAKPLPSPKHLPGRLSLSAAHTTYRTRRWVWAWRPKWMLLGGWRQTVMGGVAIAIGVMFINVIILIWGWTQQLNPYTGMRLVAHGDCNTMQNVSTYWHFAITCSPRCCWRRAMPQCSASARQREKRYVGRQGQWSKG